MPPLTTLGHEVSLLSDEVLARVKALREDAPLHTYRVQVRCTLRGGPSQAAPALSRLGPSLPDDTPHLIEGRDALPGWVEVVEKSGTVLGYVKAGALRRLQGVGK